MVPHMEVVFAFLFLIFVEVLAQSFFVTILNGTPL